MIWRSDPHAPRVDASEREQAGYSLLELIVVLAVLGLIVALTPNAYSAIRPGLEARAAAIECATELRRARALAMRSANDVLALVNVSERTLTVPAAEAPITFSDQLVVSAFVAESERPSETVGGIRFFHDGGSTGGRVHFATRHVVYRVDVDWLVGTVRVSRHEPRE